MDKSSDDNQHSVGHRERLRGRFLVGDAVALTDLSLLELLLSYAILRCDVQPLAKSLLARFGSLDAVLAADPAALRKVSGVKDATIALLKVAEHLRHKKTAPTNEPAPSIAALPPGPSEIVVSTVPSQSAPVPMDVLAELPETVEHVCSHVENAPNPAATSAKPRGESERKLQVSNGYLLDTAQLARLLTFIQSKPKTRKITAAELIEGSGLSCRQMESLVSMGSALGLITPRIQLLTPFGTRVAKHDLFLDSVTTLEFCHFLAAGRMRNLVWFEVFNDLLATQPPVARRAWSSWLRQRLAGQYTAASLMKHVGHEVRFLLDAYLVRNFKKLNLLTETPEHTYAVRRYAGLQPLSLAAMIYAFCARSGSRVISFADLHSQPGSIGAIFALDAATLRQMVETLHQREWLRFEVRHGLDQLRLIEGFEPLEFIAAAYENRAPQPGVPPQPPPTTPLLL